MTELTLRELDGIGKYLAKVIEVQQENDDSNAEIALDLPERIALDRTINGLTLGHIQYSDDRKEYVFVPLEERQAPKWAVPIPPPFD